ncbi:MAG: hypothetical protein JWO22_2868 [Frankiales bacterium]|nr:hypothetical protein [Frankiales bacterium]
MTRPGQYVLVALALTAALWPAALAHAESGTDTANVTLGNEAWYTFPDCPVAGVCLPSMASSYPADTLHVAVSGGRETARTYLALAAAPLPSGSTITGGDLLLPLDTTTANNGSLNPELSDLVVCTTSSSITPTSASTATPPAVNCLAKAIAKIVGTPATALDVNLAPLATALNQPHTNLVLMAGDISKTNANYHVVFSSNRRPSPPVAPPSLTLTYRSAPQPASPSASGSSGPQPSPGEPQTTGALPASTSLNPGSPPVPPSLGLTPPQVAVQAPALPSQGSPAVVPLGGAGAPITPSADSQQRIYDYPAVFLLPLVLVAGVVGLGRQLTRL